MCDRTPTGLENAACREGSRPSKGNTRSKRDWGCGAGDGRDAGPDKSRAGDRLLSTTPLPRTSHAETTPLDCGRNPGPDLLGLPHRALLTRRGPIKVGVWRGGVRLGISVPAPFVWRCLSGSAVAPFPHPPHRTGRADFPHPALGQDLTPSSTARRAQAGSDVRARSARRGARVDSSPPCIA